MDPSGPRSLSVREEIILPVKIDQYLTNGIKLFRVENVRPGIIDLEDCKLNRIYACPEEQFKKMGLRPVEPLQKGTEGLVVGHR